MADDPQTVDDIKKPEQRNDRPADPAGQPASKQEGGAEAKVNLEDKAAATKRNVVHGENVNRPA